MHSNTLAGCAVHVHAETKGVSGWYKMAINGARDVKREISLIFPGALFYYH